jgi:putative NADH-flavin reductase
MTKRIIVTGATGMVGSEVVRQAILDDEIEMVTAIVRKPLDIQHSKLKTIIHKDFNDYSNISDLFKQRDACIWCLGISQYQVSKNDFEMITYNYTVEAAKAMLNVNYYSRST